MRAFAAAVTREREHLTELDAAIGDADHGINMDRGMQAVVAKLDEWPEGGGAAGGAGGGALGGAPGGAGGGALGGAPGGAPGSTPGGAPGDVPDGAAPVGALLKAIGMTLVSSVGGAAGPLYGTLFLRMAAASGDASALTVEQWSAALEAGVAGAQARGKAESDDKTMIDALLPAVAALRAAVAAGRAPGDALRESAAAAERGMKATTPLVARKGRASYLGERSAGTQDPGATSSWLLLEAAAATLFAGSAS
jgi:dihydroxyacetone kinase-like protein